MEFESRLEMMKAILKPDANLCEVGVFLGEFSSTLLRFRPARLVLVDPWEGILPSGDVDGNNVKHANLPNVYEHMKEVAKEIPEIELRRGLSTDVLPTFPDATFDMLYIDSAHDYETTKKELELAWLKVKPGGFIAFHDYEINKEKCKHDYSFGVKQAVDEFMATKGISLWGKAMDGCVSGAIQVS